MQRTRTVVIPPGNRYAEDPLKAYNGHIIDFETYVGGRVEALQARTAAPWRSAPAGWPLSVCSSATCRQHAACAMQMQRATYAMQMQRTTCNMQRTTCNIRHAACSVQHDCPLSCRRRRQSAHNASPVYSTWTRYPRASRASPYILALWLHAPRVTAADQWALHMCRRECFATTSLSSSTSTPRHTRQGPVATAGRCQQRAVTAACAAPIHGGGH